MGANRGVWDHLFCKTLLQLTYNDHWTLTWQEGLPSPGPKWKEYKEHASARFRCLRCNGTWDSVYVTLFFYMILRKKRYRGAREGNVKGSILKQYCKNCGEGVPGTPDFDAEDIKIILDNLLIHIRRQCYNEFVDAELLPVPMHGGTHGRHRSDLCEACRWGACNWTAHSGGPEGRSGIQQPRQFESNEHVEVRMESLTIESEEKPGCERFDWCTCFCCTIVVVILILAAILIFRK